MGDGALRSERIVDCYPECRIATETESAPEPDAAGPPASRQSRQRAAEAATDDVMSLYLHEISRIPLLSADEEQRLARQLQRGRRAERRLQSQADLDEDERARLEQVIEEGARARQRLISANFRLVVSVAKRYAGLGVALPDLIQEGNIGLIRAVEKFDSTRGHKLSTYAVWWIRQAVTRALANHGRIIRLPVHTCERLSRVMRARQQLAQELGREPSMAEIGQHIDLPADKVKAVLAQSQQPLSLDVPVGEDQDGRLGDFVEDDSARVPSEDTWRAMLEQDMKAMRSCLSMREERVLEMRYGLRDGCAHTLDEVGSHFGLTRERIRQIEAQALGKLRQPCRRQKLRDYLA